MKDKLKELWDKLIRLNGWLYDHDPVYGKRGSRRGLSGKTKSEPQARQTPDQAQHNDELFRELTSADHRGGRW